MAVWKGQEEFDVQHEQRIESTNQNSPRRLNVELGRRRNY